MNGVNRINRNVTFKDIIVYILIVGIVAGGFSESVDGFFSNIQPLLDKASMGMENLGVIESILFLPPMLFLGLVGISFYIIQIPGVVLRTYGSPKFSMVIGFIILLLYANRRFFKVKELNFVIIFGGLLSLGYYHGIMLDKNPYYFYTITILVIPQLVNILVYFIYKDRG